MGFHDVVWGGGGDPQNEGALVILVHADSEEYIKVHIIGSSSGESNSHWWVLHTKGQ